MDVKPEKWVDPEVYREKRLTTIRLYCDVHWTIVANEPRQPNTRQKPIRQIKPEIQEWLDTMGFPHTLTLGGGGRSKVRFREKKHAMLFKLAWK